MTYEDAHRRLLGLPAQLAGFQDRGLLRVGGLADVVVYDPTELAVGPNVVVHDLPGGESRRIQKATGYHAVIVNGAQTIADDEQTNQHSGQLLRHGEADQRQSLAVQRDLDRCERPERCGTNPALQGGTLADGFIVSIMFEALVVSIRIAPTASKPSEGRAGSA